MSNVCDIMEMNSGSNSSPRQSADKDLDPKIPPVVVGDQCIVQLVSIPRKIFDQLQDDTAALREIVQTIQMATGAVIKGVDRETMRSTAGQHFGQKARKEYFFQLSGSMAQVDRAKEELNRTLKNSDPSERVSLKMDVSFSDHSFIIGRFGRGIQNVSHETNCLIHFPDSNKNSQYEKSNQVSISGPPDGVLEARRRIRKLLPISFAFVIADAHHNDALWQVGPQAFETRPRVQEMINLLQNEHRITITMLPMHSLQSSAALVTVRGRHANIDRIKDGILKLMKFLVPDNPQLSVYVGIEVSPHHLDFVTGPAGIKLIELMKETNTTIEIPEIPDRRQSIPTVRIVGQVLNVYEAWVKFMDLLPLALLVEIPANANASQELTPMTAENAWSVGEDNLIPLSEDSSFSSISFGASKIDDVAHSLNEHLEPYDITLISRQKSREIRQWWLVIKGPEKYVDIMFEIHKSLSQDDPVAYVLSYIQKIPEPPRYSLRVNNLMSPISSGSSLDLRFRPSTGGLASCWGLPSAPSAPSGRQAPPIATSWAHPEARNVTPSSCGPSLSLSDSEGLEIFALLLKIGLLPSHDMTRSSDLIGNYHIPLNDDESASSVTSTPIKLSRPQSGLSALTGGLPNLYWRTPSEAMGGSNLSALEDPMESLRLTSTNRLSTSSGCMDRDSFNSTNQGFSGFRGASRVGPVFGSTSVSGSEQASCSGMSSHSLFDDDVLRDYRSDLPMSSKGVGELGSCVNNSSFDSSGFGSASFSPPNAFYRDVEFDSVFLKAAGDLREGDLTGYNLWGQDSSSFNSRLRDRVASNKRESTSQKDESPAASSRDTTVDLYWKSIR